MDKTAEPFVAVKIKKEKPDEDINEFAETAMNELLGWYGYGTNRDEVPGKAPRSSSCNSHRESNSPDAAESPKYPDGCEWCGKSVDETKGLSSSASGAVFCSELCFSHSRRANFKKNKTCDWCRHIRHTISYVDFQDGASQLQFCSTKCLNQYKMHIFCRETRAHLELHPHLPDDSSTSTGSLITPDLWLRNCRSPDARDSTSSNPTSPKLNENPPQTSPLPLITVAHPSKLMDASRLRAKIQKRSRKRCRSTATVSSPSPVVDVPQDLRVRHTPPQLGPCFDEPRDDRTDFSEPPRRTLHNGYPNVPYPKFMHYPPLPQAQSVPAHPPHLTSLLPPVTVMVPYPIIIPLPLPIPIPIPLSKEDFAKLTGETYCSKKQTEDGGSKGDKQQNVQKESTDETKLDVPSVTPPSHLTTKPLRKRKRMFDTKSKLEAEPVITKNKKFVPA